MRIEQRFSNGKNYVEKKVKRGYLRANEENLLMMLMTLGQLLDGTRSLDDKNDGASWDVMEKAGIITKEQKKNLKMATTYIKKFTSDLVENNLDYKEKAKLLRKAAKWNFRIVDDYQLKKLDKIYGKKDRGVSEEWFIELIDSSLFANCKGCTKDRTECKLRDFYDDNLIPRVTESCDNCEYSY